MRSSLPFPDDEVVDGRAPEQADPALGVRQGLALGQREAEALEHGAQEQDQLRVGQRLAQALSGKSNVRFKLLLLKHLKRWMKC